MSSDCIAFDLFIVYRPNYERFKAKALQFLKAHENDIVIHKLRWNDRRAIARFDISNMRSIARRPL